MALDKPATVSLGGRSESTGPAGSVTVLKKDRLYGIIGLDELNPFSEFRAACYGCGDEGGEDVELTGGFQSSPPAFQCYARNLLLNCQWIAAGGQVRGDDEVGRILLPALLHCRFTGVMPYMRATTVRDDSEALALRCTVSPRWNCVFSSRILTAGGLLAMTNVFDSRKTRPSLSRSIRRTSWVPSGRSEGARNRGLPGVFVLQSSGASLPGRRGTWRLPT